MPRLVTWGPQHLLLELHWNNNLDNTNKMLPLRHPHQDLILQEVTSCGTLPITERWTSMLLCHQLTVRNIKESGMDTGEASFPSVHCSTSGSEKSDAILQPPPASTCISGEIEQVEMTPEEPSQEGLTGLIFLVTGRIIGPISATGLTCALLNPLLIQPSQDTRLSSALCLCSSYWNHNVMDSLRPSLTMARTSCLFPLFTRWPKPTAISLETRVIPNSVYTITCSSPYVHLQT